MVRFSQIFLHTTQNNLVNIITRTVIEDFYGKRCHAKKIIFPQNLNFGSNFNIQTKLDPVSDLELRQKLLSK